MGHLEVDDLVELTVGVIDHDLQGLHAFWVQMGLGVVILHFVQHVLVQQFVLKQGHELLLDGRKCGTVHQFLYGLHPLFQRVRVQEV